VVLPEELVFEAVAVVLPPVGVAVVVLAEVVEPEDGPPVVVASLTVVPVVGAGVHPTAGLPV